MDAWGKTIEGNCNGVALMVMSWGLTSKQDHRKGIPLMKEPPCEF